MEYAIIDIESTGGSAKRDKITEIAIYRFNGQQVTDSFSTLLNPEVPIPPFIRKLTGIHDDMVADQPTFKQVAQRIIDLTKDAVFVAHNVQFDYAYIRAEFRRLGYNFHRSKLCTLQLAKQLLPGKDSYSLGKLCDELGIKIKNRHRAAGDAEATVHLFKLLLDIDVADYIPRAVRNVIPLHHLPTVLSVQAIEALPEDAGVYYFHNKAGEVIYVGKSTDIRRRVIQHFTNLVDGSKNWRMMQQVADVTFDETGSELIAMLMEVYEAARLRPRYNKRKFTMKGVYGIFQNYNEEGYLCLDVLPIRQQTKRPLVAYEKKNNANRGLWRKIEKFQLCPSLCGIQQANGSCTHYESKLCKGACIGKEKPRSYNRRVHRATEPHKYTHDDFLVIGEGRTMGEHSAVYVANHQFKGIGFFDPRYVQHIEEVRECISFMNPLPEADKIIRKYLKTNKIDKVIPVPKQ